MPNEAMVTEAEARKRERAAWDAATDAVLNRLGLIDESRPFREVAVNVKILARQVGRERYPAPQLDALRVVVDPLDPNFAHRVVGGRVEYGRSDGVGGWSAAVWRVTPERVAIWADLLANPTHLVDVDAADAEGR